MAAPSARRRGARPSPSRAGSPGTVGIGLMGCGRIARMFHLPVLTGLPSVRLVAVADPDGEARAAGVAGAAGARGFGDFEELLGAPGVEAVVVCLPSHLHAGAAVAAFEAAKHVYVEKPLALDLDEATRIRDAWRASGTVGAVGFNFRFHPLHRAARETVAAGALGDLVAARGVISSAPRRLPEWKRARRTGGGALLDLATHHVDLVPYLLGEEVTAVSAAIRTAVSEGDTVALSLHLRSGLLAQVLATASAPQSDRLEILGTAASLVVDRMASRRLSLTPTPAPAPAGRAGRAVAAGRALRDGLLGTLDRLRPPPEPSFRTALEAFVASARAGAPSTPLLATVEDGARAAAVVEAAERSAATGTLVPVAGTEPA